MQGGLIPPGQLVQRGFKYLNMSSKLCSQFMLNTVLHDQPFQSISQPGTLTVFGREYSLVIYMFLRIHHGKLNVLRR